MGDSGHITVASGSANSGRGGYIQLSVGTGNSGEGGHVEISAGQTSDSTGATGGYLSVASGYSVVSSSGPILLRTPNSGALGKLVLPLLALFYTSINIILPFYSCFLTNIITTHIRYLALTHIIFILYI